MSYLSLNGGLKKRMSIETASEKGKGKKRETVTEFVIFIDERRVEKSEGRLKRRTKKNRKKKRKKRKQKEETGRKTGQIAAPRDEKQFCANFLIFVPSKFGFRIDTWGGFMVLYNR